MNMEVGMVNQGRKNDNMKIRRRETYPRNEEAEQQRNRKKKVKLKATRIL
ncbi:hypothetical protein Fmac_012240 [Flemingia macrophylla]|uniref:Uncharacterized protein n=1 Tax=Flemingia macrophylla TaxID=520843 RepID=A0ABD1MPS5_9FABA